ncbi:MAG: hypothetical protein HKN12_07650 [Gemmatimonadetes bacterium]|nr:hypothetical protein [Gemmatimonadota bacterium]
MKPEDVIAGAERLVKIYDGWPSFHDAEVLDVRLERLGRDEYDGPVVSLCFHLFWGEKSAETDSGFHWTNHHRVTLRCRQVVDLELRGFNRQNAIYDFKIHADGHHPEASGVPALRITLEPSFGIACTLRCTSVEVADIEPGPPPDTVYSD